MRTTNDKKDYSLRIRLNDSMYNHLTKESGRRNTSVSNYVRDLISNDIRNKNERSKDILSRPL